MNEPEALPPESAFSKKVGSSYLPIQPMPKTLPGSGRSDPSLEQYLPAI